MLTTPLGDIEIYIDNEKVEYAVKNIGASERLCPDVRGRFCIDVYKRQHLMLLIYLKLLTVHSVLWNRQSYQYPSA